MAKFQFRWQGLMPKDLRMFAEYLSNPWALGFWDKITEWLQRIVARLLTGKGGAYGREAYPDIAPSIYELKRKGTDGEYHGLYRDRPSEPGIASGRWRDSFKLLAVPRPTVMEYGSAHEKAEVIPYGGWNRRDGLFKPRHLLPMRASEEYKRELSDHVNESLVLEAMRRARI